MITDFERKIIDLIKDEEIEHVIILLGDDVCFHNQGTGDKVNAPIRPDLLKGSTFIHNHPVFKWIENDEEYEIGASLDDLKVCMRNKAKRLLLVENTGEFTDITEYEIK